MHTWLRILWIHVEPDACSHGQEAIFMDELGVLEQEKLAIVRARSEDVGELTIVIVPAELEWSPAIVLFVGSVWPSVTSPASLIVVACRISSSVESRITTNFLNPVEGLGPELTIARVSLTSLLSPVCKDRRHFSLASIIETATCLISLIAEVGELSHSLQEVVISIDWICLWESSDPIIR